MTEPEAVHAGLLVSTGTDSFRFSHEVIREYLCQDITASRRLRLHGQIAHTLQARFDQDRSGGSQQRTELAHHFTQSGDRIQGTWYAQRAVAQALRAYVSQQFEALIRAPLHGVVTDKNLVNAFLPGTDSFFVLKSTKKETLCHQRWLTLISDLEVAAQAAQELGLVEWWQEALLAAQEALEQLQALEQSRSSLADIHLFVERARPLIAHIGQRPEGQAYAHRLLELAHCLADSQKTSTDQPTGNEPCILPLPV
jgi:hypothetical protein